MRDEDTTWCMTDILTWAACNSVSLISVGVGQWMLEGDPSPQALEKFRDHAPVSPCITTKFGPRVRALDLSALERRGLSGLLDEMEGELTNRYSGQIWNGGRCPRCEREGQGMPAEHAPDCRGVRMLADVRAAKERLK